MNSRERIVAVINHKETDVLPIDFGAMRSTGISIQAYSKLKKYLGMDNSLPKLYDVFQQLAEPETELLERMGGDVVQAHRMAPAFGISIKEWKQAQLPSGITCLVPAGYNPVVNDDGSQDIIENGKVIAHMPPSGLYFDLVDAPLKDAESIEDVDKIPIPLITDEELDFIEQEVMHLHYNTDKAILLAFGGNILEAGQTWWGFEKFMEYLVIEPELIHYWLGKLTEAYMHDLQKLLPRVAKYINILQFGDDLGSQTSLLISPETYRKMIKPYHKKLYRYVRDNYPDVKVFLHSCGAIEKLLPDLIDAGVEIINPVQISAEGMDPFKLKKNYGKDLVFWGGGANMQHTVISGTIEDIKKEVESLIRIFNEGGGYVFNQVHNIQANVPPEKIMAVYDTALAYRERQRAGLKT